MTHDDSVRYTSAEIGLFQTRDGLLDLESAGRCAAVVLFSNALVPNLPPKFPATNSLQAGMAEWQLLMAHGSRPVTSYSSEHRRDSFQSIRLPETPASLSIWDSSLTYGHCLLVLYLEHTVASLRSLRSPWSSTSKLVMVRKCECSICSIMWGRLATNSISRNA